MGEQIEHGQAEGQTAGDLLPAERWLAFDVSIFREPADITQLGSYTVHGVELTRLDPRGLTREALFPVGFDEVCAALANLSRTDVEPDGFFVRAGQAEHLEWQLNGHLYELDDRLWRVDLHGKCPSNALDEVLATFGWPRTPIIFQLIYEGLLVSELDFRRWADALGSRLGGP